MLFLRALARSEIKTRIHDLKFPILFLKAVIVLLSIPPSDYRLLKGYMAQVFLCMVLWIYEDSKLVIFTETQTNFPNNVNKSTSLPTSEHVSKYSLADKPHNWNLMASQRINFAVSDKHNKNVRDIFQK